MGLSDAFGRFFSRSTAGAAPAPAPATRSVQMDYNDPRIPAGAQDRVRRILACLQEVEALAAREQIGSFNRIDIDQMRDLHLPKLVRSYVEIPAAHRSEIFRTTGKSASYILNDSLDKMQAKIDDILRNLAQHDIEAFTQNARFIGQRYADDDNPFS